MIRAQVPLDNIEEHIASTLIEASKALLCRERDSNLKDI